MNRCVVLMYHVVDEPRSDGEARYCCRPDHFRAQMRLLVDNGWRVISLAELAGCVRTGQQPPARTAVITFDDGTACTAETALPILTALGLTATVFVVSDLVGGFNDWMVAGGQPRRQMLSQQQLLELDAAGLDIGSHAARHQRMTHGPLEAARRGAADSKSRLEDLLGRPVRHFAYPYGDHDEAVRRAVIDAGYEAACSTRWGKNGAGADLFALKRVEIRGGDTLWQFRFKLLSGTHDMPPLSLPRALARRVNHRVRTITGSNAQS